MKKCLLSFLIALFWTISPVQAYMNSSSSDNRLASLIINQVSLSPKFISTITSYRATTKLSSVQVNALAASTRATLSGTGSYNLKTGENTITIKVRAANGQSRNYTVVLTREKTANKNTTKSPVVTYQNKTYSVVTDLSNLSFPDHFTLSSTKIKGQEVVALKHEKADYTIVCLADANKNKNFFVVHNGKITGRFTPLIIQGETYLPLKSPEKQKSNLTYKTLTCQNVTLQGFTFNDSAYKNYQVFYLLGPSGKPHYYTYEKSEGTLQIYREDDGGLGDLNPILLITTFFLAISFVILFIKYRSFKAMSLKKLKRFNYLACKKDM